MSVGVILLFEEEIADGDRTYLNHAGYDKLTYASTR